MQTTEAALHSGSDPSLPPLMNPTILEASEDLTNLSHLNEPAGEIFAIPIMATDIDLFYSPPSHPFTVLSKRNLHIFWNRSHSHQSICAGGFIICPSDGASICWKAACLASATFVRHCRGGIHVSFRAALAAMFAD